MLKNDREISNTEIVRVKKNNILPMAVHLPNSQMLFRRDIFDDRRLSFEDVGLLMRVLGSPDFRVSVDALYEGPDPKHVVDTCLSNLVQFGYLRIEGDIVSAIQEPEPAV